MLQASGVITRKVYYLAGQFQKCNKIMLYWIICHFVASFSNEEVSGVFLVRYSLHANRLRKQDIIETYNKYMTHSELPIWKCHWHPGVIAPEPCFLVLLKSPMHEGCTHSLKEEKKGQLLNIAVPRLFCQLYSSPRVSPGQA